MSGRVLTNEEIDAIVAEPWTAHLLNYDDIARTLDVLRRSAKAWHRYTIAYAERERGYASRAEKAEAERDALREALRRLVERIDKVYVENLHREMLIEEQWPLLDEVNTARALLAGFSGDASKEERGG